MSKVAKSNLFSRSRGARVIELIIGSEVIEQPRLLFADFSVRGEGGTVDVIAIKYWRSRVCWMSAGSLVNHIQALNHCVNQEKRAFRTITFALKACRHVEKMMWLSLLMSPPRPAE